MKDTRISIVGLGQVGTAFLNVLSSNKCEVVSVFNRTEVSASVSSRFPGIFFETGVPSNNDPIGNLIMITVSDDAIEEVSKNIASQFESLHGFMFVHCSGTYTSGKLSSLQKKGAKTASFHPMKSTTESTESFQGTWFDIEGDEEVLIRLEEIAKNFNANTFRVKPEAKPFLHAAAVVASNYLVVLANLVSKISAEGNVSEEIALKAMAPLMYSTIQNIEEEGITNALTGPIARGDVEIVRKHLRSLQNVPELISLYKTLGVEAVRIAEQKNGSSSALEEIKKLFS